MTNPDAGRVASAGRRLAGYLVDCVAWGLAWGVATAMVFGGAAEEAYGMVLLGLLLLLGYGALYLVLLARGQSYGKWVLGMRAYAVTGRPAGFLAMLVRETLGKFISGLVFSLGYLWLLWDPNRQTWHDKVVSTVVLVPGRR